MRHSFRYGGVIEGLDAAEHGGDHAEAAVERGVARRQHGVIGEAVHETGDEEAAAAREGEDEGGRWRGFGGVELIE